MFIKSFTALFLMGIFAATAGTVPANVAFVTARLEKVEDVTRASQNQVYVDGAYRLTFTLSKTLIGTLSERSITLTVQKARPIPGYNYYLLLTKADGEAHAIWSGIAANGVCIGEETSEKYGIATAIKGLKQQHPCKV